MRGTLRGISEVLQNALPEKLLMHFRIKEIKLLWTDVAGAALAKRTEPIMMEYAEDGQLYLVVSAKSPAAAQKINLLGKPIAKKIKLLFDIDISGVRTM